MIRLVTWGKRGPLIVLGVTQENVRRLRQGKPIYVNLGEFRSTISDLTLASVAITYGKTHRAVLDQLTAAGLDLPAAVVEQADALDAELDDDG